MADNQTDSDCRSLLALRLAYYGEVVVALIDWTVRGVVRHSLFATSLTEFVLAIAGLLLVLSGLTLRLVASRALGHWWSLRAEIRDGQPLVRGGPYHVIRHPAYLGMLLVCLGIPLALASIWAAVVMALAMWPAIAHRIGIEERLLEDHFGDEYRDYARRTARLVPGVF